jgi:hypothetical protein
MLAGPGAGSEVTDRAPPDRVIPTISPAVTQTRSTAPVVVGGPRPRPPRKPVRPPQHVYMRARHPPPKSRPCRPVIARRAPSVFRAARG